MYREAPGTPQPFAGAGPPAARGAEMSERKRLVAGNWKMNGLRADGLALARGIAERAREPHRCELLVCPPSTLLMAVGEAPARPGARLRGAEWPPHPQGGFTPHTSHRELQRAV